jgi:hypothetical protein
MAATIGTVACPPQVIRFTFSLSSATAMFTGGTTEGPILAGVRSMTFRPASAYFEALTRCT